MQSMPLFTWNMCIVSNQNEYWAHRGSSRRMISCLDRSTRYNPASCAHLHSANIISMVMVLFIPVMKQSIRIRSTIGLRPLQQFAIVTAAMRGPPSQRTYYPRVPNYGLSSVQSGIRCTQDTLSQVLNAVVNVVNLFIRHGSVQSCSASCSKNSFVEIFPYRVLEMVRTCTMLVVVRAASPGSGIDGCRKH